MLEQDSLWNQNEEKAALIFRQHCRLSVFWLSLTNLRCIDLLRFEQSKQIGLHFLVSVDVFMNMNGIES